ncbi:MAG: NADH-quinone oxidoreductase subunit M [Candidatus Aminicenantes bacterium]|nr:NADH-quinone oxidoreductase subunit M [Candidatus Aminicenantes bacterium]
MSAPQLSLITFLPLGGAVLLMFIPKEERRRLLVTALCFSLAALVLTVVLAVRFDGAEAGPQFVEDSSWLGFGIRYQLGVDGLSLFMVCLTAFLVPLVLLASWMSIKDRFKEYLLFMLVLETGMIGVFLSLNLFLFYVFWEAALIPMYFLIGIFGGKRRIYATTKFVLYTMAGSLLMLVGIFVLQAAFARAAGTYSLNVFDLYRLSLSHGTQAWLFLAFGLAFAIKVPLFPFHTWLPDAHVEAPTGASVLLAAVLLKMGAYGFIRFAFPLFPDAVARFAPVLAVLAIIGILYGGLMALVQKDIKSLVAYSSVNHMGLIVLALAAWNTIGLQGALLQMVNHGLSTGMLFFAVGALYDRTHTRLISDYGGVARRMPVFSALFLIAALSSLGLPGLNGFAGEILCFAGIFAAHKVWAVLAVATVILAAAYLLGMYQKVCHGPVVHDRVAALRDLRPEELAVFVPIVILMFWIGIFPGTFLGKTEATAARYDLLIRSRSNAFIEVRRPADFSSDPITAGAPAGERP